MPLADLITGQCTSLVACRICWRSRRRTPETGVCFTQPPRRNPIARVLVPGSGTPKQKNALLKLKSPAHLTQHRAAARKSAPPHDDPSPTGRAPCHGAGIRPPEGRHVSSGHIRARLAPVLYPRVHQMQLAKIDDVERVRKVASQISKRFISKL